MTALAFNQLFEAAVVKETRCTSARHSAQSAPALAPLQPTVQPMPEAQPPQTTAPEIHMLHDQKPKPTQCIKAASRPTLPHKLTNKQLATIPEEHAAAEHERLQQHLSLKWTWGVDLEHADIHELCCATDQNYELPHTGYDESLVNGLLKGDDSSARPMPGSGIYSIIEDIFMPELSAHDMPVHFHNFPLHCPHTQMIIGDLLTGGDIPSPTASNLAFSLYSGNDYDDASASGNTGNKQVPLSSSPLIETEVENSNPVGDFLEALAASSSSSSSNPAVDILEALAALSSSSASSSNPAGDVLEALTAASSSSSSSANPADTILQALTAVNDSDEELDDDMMQVVACQAQGTMWTAKHFAGYPDPNDYSDLEYVDA